MLHICYIYVNVYVTDEDLLELCLPEAFWQDRQVLLALMDTRELAIRRALDTPAEAMESDENEYKKSSDLV